MQPIRKINQASEDFSGRADCLKALSMEHLQFNQPDYHQRISDRVHDYVVEKILSGDWTSGSPITETSLIKELSISNGPVREAITQLHQEGWIERRPHRGMTISDFDDKQKLKNLAIFRMSLELGPACILADSATSGQIEDLKEILQELETAAAQNDRPAYVLADLRFHQTIVHYGGGEWIGKQFDTALLQMFMSEYSNEPTEQLSHNHKDIIDAIINHDMATMVQVIKGHIERYIDTPANTQRDHA